MYLVKVIFRLTYLKPHNYCSTFLNSINNFKKCRNIHTNSKLCIKMFMEHENKYAYNIMENKGYVISLNAKTDITHLSRQDFEQILQQDWSKKSPQYLIQIFPKLGMYCSKHNLCISNKVFDGYIDYLTDNVKHASDEELKDLFYSITQWPETESIRTRNFIEMWAALDDECLNRMGSWSFNDMLSYVALFYMLNVTRVSDFTTKCLNRLATKAKQLSPEQLVQTMFFIGIYRKSPFDIHNLEIFIDNNFSKFTLDELSIIAMGFFKSKTPLRNLELVSKIINKITENSKNIHEVSLAALLKIIRYSMKLSNDDKLYMLLDTLQHEVPRLSIMCNIHVALLGTTTLTLHKGCLNKIANSINNSISKARLKDLERLIMTCGIFNFKPDTRENLLDKVMCELRNPERIQEIKKHGRSFACCVAYLGLLGIYPTDLMSKALSPEFLEQTYGKHSFSYGKEILVIHNSAKIFCQKVFMNRLSDKAAILLAKKYTDFAPSDDFKKQYNVSEKMFLDIMKLLKHDRGDTYVLADHILTHHQKADIILCNSHEGLPLPVTEAFSKKEYGLIRTPTDHNLWVVLVIGGRNAIIRDSNEATGPFQAKLRELKALGFHSALVPWSIYSNIANTEEKLNYLNYTIKESLKNRNFSENCA